MKLTDQRGEVIATYAYGTYGELLRGDTTLTRFLYNGRCGVETDSNGLYYMRQRYYSPEMKRFLNQDVVRGSLTASQSLNRYSYVQGNPVSYTDPFGLSPLNGLFTGTNFWHAVLGFIGCVPGPVGMVANLADAAVYALIDHDYGMAALAMLDCVSGGLSTLAKAASAAGKATKTARYLKTAGSLISNVSSFAQNASAGMATAFGMYEKYMIKGEEFDSSTPWEIASLGLSILGMGISGRGIAGDTKALSKMLNEDMFSSRMRNAVRAFAADNRGCVNLGAFKSGRTSVVNSKGVAYPEVMDIRTGQNMVFPEGVGSRVPKDSRVGWYRNQSEANLYRVNDTDILCKKDYIDEWYRRGYQTPEGGWDLYEIHHIKPREFGGSAVFENMVPLLKDVHRKVVTPWWNGYGQ